MPILANAVVDLFHKGGPIMYPIAVVTVVAVCIFVERVFWWLRFTAKRSTKQLDEVYEKLEAGDLAKAIAISAGSGDPVVRMIHHGLNHRHTSICLLYTSVLKLTPGGGWFW